MLLDARHPGLRSGRVAVAGHGRRTPAVERSEHQPVDLLDTADDEPIGLVDVEAEAEPEHGRTVGPPIRRRSDLGRGDTRAD
ncbi:MAG: hypothetical protein IPF42_15735 [Candidatus Microthrix sp.]|nr:hypothetical protein [Candidatus Microthrix sp.]